MASWVTTAEGHECTRHQQTFARGEVCSMCATDPGDDEPPVEAEYDRHLVARIGEYRSSALAFKRAALELLGEPGEKEKATDRDVAAACKAMAEATKLFRLAEERQEIVDAREHELRLIRHEREMSGLRGSH